VWVFSSISIRFGRIKVRQLFCIFISLPLGYI
jgi:hypothetical protein